MSESGCLNSVELARKFVTIGEEKAALPLGKTLLLAILAGAYIGFGAHLATSVSTGNGELYGITKLISGGVFSVGLMLVVIAGAELFTGNNMMTMALCSRRVSPWGVLGNWGLVYAGNLAGSIFLALIVAWGSGLLAGPVGGTAIKIAAAKVSVEGVGGVGHNFAFFLRGIACNWLVCLALVMAAASRDVTGKILAIFFPIMAFVASGFEHSIANMYFIPAGIFAAKCEAARVASGLSAEQLAGINWTSMWTENLISVTLGNIVGGGIFAGMAYFWLHLRGADKESPCSNGATPNREGQELLARFFFFVLQ